MYEDIYIPKIVKDAGIPAVDAFKERISICVVHGGLSEAEAFAVAIRDFNESQQEGESDD